MNSSSKYKVLFVCLGNICRSPAAEGIFRHLVKKNGLDKSILIDSAATSGWNTGSKVDSRMNSAASKRGYDLTSRARQVTLSDFSIFDVILAMDKENYIDLRKMAPNEESYGKLRYITDFATTYTIDHVPDPYYGGHEGFELVLDLLEDCCKGLLGYVIERTLKK